MIVSIFDDIRPESFYQDMVEPEQGEEIINEIEEDGKED